jgi:hypothetical protein
MRDARAMIVSAAAVGAKVVQVIEKFRAGAVSALCNLPRNVAIRLHQLYAFLRMRPALVPIGNAL